jgi:hypothetical protein
MIPSTRSKIGWGIGYWSKGTYGSYGFVLGVLLLELLAELVPVQRQQKRKVNPVGRT